jgi:predicted helicase
MDPNDIEKLRKLTSFEALVDYLRDELDWPIEAEDAEKAAFDYDLKELGIDPIHTVKIETIKQIRPLSDKQPWGVFYIQFENKNLPVVVLRRILHALVPASRRRDPDRKAWKMSDLLFISSQGAENDRSISFAHFQEVDGKAQLRTFAWDVKETHLYYIKNLNLNALRWPADVGNAEAWRKQWGEAFTVAYRYVPTTAEMLAKKMAQIASYIREAVELTYSMEHSGGPLHQLHLSLKMDLISDLSEADFADMYAQTVTYGLFAARATRSGEFKSTDAKALIAHTNPFLRELLEQLMNQQMLDLDELGVTELTDLLGKVNMEAILQDFGRQKKGEDPVIHFYETFMREYDPDQKTKRGEFYTPDPVVSFIVRSVDYLLKAKFDCHDGLASTSANAKGFQPVILDPATGTGTFLKYVIEVIWETFYEKNKKLSAFNRRAKWNRFVRENVLPRLYAFELKMSPYTIAHMKVGLALQEKGFDFEEGERLQIYLTNSLQPAHEIARVDTAALAHESELANEVKNKAPITVVIGNPPYSGHSANASRDSKGVLNFIGNLLQDYYKVDGKPLGEKNPKWLQDDYVKFIRFAQWRITESGVGIVAMITNHGYLDNPTFRGMRQQLMQAFDEIYVLDLHGNAKKKETAPDGSKDENVFDIQQGVAISLMMKCSNKKDLAKVFHADLFGLREYKYEWLMIHHSNMSSVDWKSLNPQKPFYVFTEQNEHLREEYYSYPLITELMPVNILGFQTHRDDFAVNFDHQELLSRINDMLNEKISDDEFRQKHQVTDSGTWKLSKARTQIRRKRNWEDFIVECDYRPFDKRFVFLDEILTDRPRPELLLHVANQKNLCLLSSRQQATEGYRHCWVANTPPNDCVVSNISHEANQVFPLYTYETPDSTAGTLFAQKLITRQPNISVRFKQAFEHIFGLQFVKEGIGDLRTTFGPEDVFHHIYAVFHSPTYRSRYAEFLKIDFPHLPLTSNVELFRQLCGLGKELVALHLLEASVLNKPNTEFKGKGDNIVAKGHPKYQGGVVRINPTQSFKGVPEDVWEFHIGGYQVCEKWLKDRRGRELSSEDITHYQKIVIALGETIRLMGEVDEAIESAGGWPMK